MKPNQIALIEIGGSHAECLLTQMHAIKKLGYEILLVCTDNIKTQNPIFESYVDQFYIVDLSKSRVKTKNEIKNIWNQIKKLKINKVIFNTAQGNYVRSLCLYALFNKVEFIGIVHTTLKFKGSFTQKIISLKIKKYLLLSEYLLSTIKPPNQLCIDYFYPIRYPSFNKNITKNNPFITIIGGVENERRDLCGFADMLISTKDIDASYVFLGKTNKHDKDVVEFRKKLSSHGLNNKVISFDNYVSQETFDAYLRNTDLILPLVHPNTPSESQYFKNQISGAMSISFGYKIPLLIHDAYFHISEMKCASFYYNKNSFPKVLKESLSTSKEKVKKMRANTHYNVKQQEERYIKFISLPIQK